jgi:pimeloyl-ACP methyl ester carboxylesterase
MIVPGALLLLASALAAPPMPLAGDWSGALVFRGDAWPVRLAVTTTADGPEARLDLPELGMRGEPVSAGVSGDRLAIEMPFGLGRFELDGSQGTISDRSTLRDEPIGLWLAPALPRAIVEEPVRFPSGPLRLAGTLHRPAGPGPFPAVVLLHGSGTLERGNWSYRSWIEPFLGRGFAVLAFDRRDAGENLPPDPQPMPAPDLDTLAEDAVAAVDFLAARREIDGRRIGLSGGSQGGWVALAAAARSKQVAFLVLRAAPAGTPAEQELQSVARRAEAQEPAAVVARAVAHTRLYFTVVATGEGWPELERSVARAHAEGWDGYVQTPEAPEHLGWWRRNHDFDPRTFAAHIRVPVLAFYGEADDVVPADENAGRLAALLTGTDATIVTVPGADHGLERPFGPGADGRWRFARRAPEVQEALAAWLEARFPALSGGLP